MHTVAMIKKEKSFNPFFLFLLSPILDSRFIILSL